MLNIEIKEPGELEGALDRMSLTLCTELPEAVRGYMVVVPAFAILRCVYGGPFRAIWAMFVWQVRALWR